MTASLLEKRALAVERGLVPTSVSPSLIEEWTYQTNALEGSALTLADTAAVLAGRTVAGRTLRDHLEAANHADAIRRVQEAARAGEALNEELILSIHRVAQRYIDTDDIPGATTSRSTALPRRQDLGSVADEFAKLAAEYTARLGDGRDIARACWLHCEILRIHPFATGNGRTARLLLNFELLRTGWPPAIIRTEDCGRYYEALDAAHSAKDLAPIQALVEDRLADALGK